MAEADKGGLTMLKCKIDKAKGPVWVKAKGDLNTITVEVMALFKEVHRNIAQQNPEAAREFRNTVTAAMLDPTSPLWKED